MRPFPVYNIPISYSPQIEDPNTLLKSKYSPKQVLTQDYLTTQREKWIFPKIIILISGIANRAGERQRTPLPPLAASEASRHFSGLIMIKN